MKILRPLCVTMLALSASAGNVAASDSPPPTARAHVVSDDSLGFINTANNSGWETPDLPYARLLTQGTTLNATPRWRSASARQGPLPPPTATTPAVQQANVPPPVPEASMISMLLVGLGLLAFSMHGEKQEKFDS